MLGNLLLVLLCCVLTGHTAAAQTICPADDAQSREAPIRYLTRDNFADHRAQVGLTGYSTTQIRLLTDATDSAACGWFATEFGPGTANWRWTAYQVGNLYFVAFRYINSDGGYRLGFVPLYIFDQSYTQVGGFAM